MDLWLQNFNYTIMHVICNALSVTYNTNHGISKKHPFAVYLGHFQIDLNEIYLSFGHDVLE